MIRLEINLTIIYEIWLYFQPRLFAGDLLDLVASHFKLREKQYFGLAFIDDS